MYSIIRIAIYFVVITSALSAIFMLGFHSLSTDMLATEQAVTGEVCDQNGVTYFINNQEMIDNNISKKLFIFGASNTRIGFKPAVIKQTLTEFDVYNFGFSGGNISEAILALDVIKVSKKEITYLGAYAVLGISFGVVVDDAIRWGANASPLENAMARVGLFAGGDGLIVNEYSKSLKNIYIKAGLPFRCINKRLFQAKTKLKLSVKELLGTLLKQRDRSSLEVIDNWKKSYEAKPLAYSNEIQNIKLFVSKAQKMKMVPIVIDLPLEKIVYENSRHDKIYRGLLKEFLKTNFFDYINMRNSKIKSEFSDLVHPTRATSVLWSEWLAKEILKRES